jgi:hypothetical protein
MVVTNPHWFKLKRSMRQTFFRSLLSFFVPNLFLSCFFQDHCSIDFCKCYKFCESRLSRNFVVVVESLLDYLPLPVIPQVNHHC